MLAAYEEAKRAIRSGECPPPQRGSPRLDASARSTFGRGSKNTFCQPHVVSVTRISRSV